MNFVGLTALVKRLPSYAEDVKKNVQELFSKELPGLNIRQMYGIALASGYFLQNEQLLNDIRSEAKIHLEEPVATAAKSAVITTCMTSTYYGFTSTTYDDQIKGTPANLNLNSFSDPEILKTDFELYCLAVSFFLKCKYCSDHHIKSLLAQGVSREAISNVARIVAVLMAAKAALEIESMRSYEFIARDSIF